MSGTEKIAIKAARQLICTIETLEELCEARKKYKLSVARYRRLISELRDLSRLLSVYNSSENGETVLPDEVSGISGPDCQHSVNRS